MTVYLVGAGPGDPGLFTVRGAEVLGRADVVVHDRLADSRILRLAPPAARLIDVGKAPGGPVHQDEINDLLVAEGTAGHAVVRLKGGDPFVFGRGGEEAEALSSAGVDFEVVPGITSAVAVPAYAGVPVTHRGRATSFTVVTGHSRHAADRETDWEALARAGGTIVVLMGVARRGLIADRLLAGGLDPATPVAAVHWGTRPYQKTVRTRLDHLGRTHLDAPSTIVIGRVAGLDLGWYERKPLFGRRVVVTRSRKQASALAGRLAELGAGVVELPTIRIEASADGGAGLDRAATSIGTYDWAVFTSANAVDALLSRIDDVRSLAGVKVAAVGEATAAALARHRIVADLVPSAGRREAAGLADSMGPGRGRVVFPRAAEGREVLVEALTSGGWDVDLVEAYRTVPASADPDAAAELAGADAICFSSASTVTGFVGVYGADSAPPVVACIGPVTAAAARAAGLTVSVVASDPSVNGLVDALVACLKA